MSYETSQNPEWSISDGQPSEKDKPAAFQGSLVSIRNTATHKSVVLQIEAPEEYGAALVAAFGWPTRVNPVPVAVARLNDKGETHD